MLSIVHSQFYRHRKQRQAVAAASAVAFLASVYASVSRVIFTQLNLRNGVWNLGAASCIFAGIISVDISLLIIPQLRSDAARTVEVGPPELVGKEFLAVHVLTDLIFPQAVHGRTLFEDDKTVRVTAFHDLRFVFGEQLWCQFDRQPVIQDIREFLTGKIFVEESLRNFNEVRFFPPLSKNNSCRIRNRDLL